MRFSHYSHNWRSSSSRLHFAVFSFLFVSYSYLLEIFNIFSSKFAWTNLDNGVGADVNVLKKGLWEKESDGKVAVGAVFCVYASLSGSSNHISIMSHVWKLHFSFLRLLTSFCRYQPPLPSLLQRERLRWWPIKSCGILSLDPLTLRWFDPPVRKSKSDRATWSEMRGRMQGGLHTSVHLPCTASLCSCIKSAFGQFNF